jgi:hypothetical protein
MGTALQGRCALLLCAAAFMAIPAMSQEAIEDPCPVSAALSTNSELTIGYSALMTEGDTLDRTAAEFNGRCGTSHDPASAVGQACTRDFKPLDSHIKQHNQAVRRFNGTQVSAFDAESLVLRERMNATQTKIQTELHTSRDLQRQTEQWVDLSEHEKHIVFWHSIFGLADGVAESFGQGADAGIELTEEQSSRFTAWYASYGQTLPDADRVRLAARISTLRTHKDIATLIGWLAQTGERATGLIAPLSEDHYTEALVTGTLDTLNMAVKVAGTNPELVVAVSTVQLIYAESDFFVAIYAANESVNSLGFAQGQSARAINSLGQLYAKDLQRMKAAQKAQTELKGSECFSGS